MIDKKMAIRIGGLAVAMACAVITAKADVTTQYTIGGTADLKTVNVSVDGINEGGGSAYAGGIQLNKVAGSGPGPGSFVSVCTDLEATVWIGDTYYYEGPVVFGQSYTGNLTGLPDPSWGQNNSDPTKKSANAAAAIQAAADLYYQYHSFLGGSDVNQQAALQIAVWAVLYNTTTVGGTTSTSLNLNGSSSSANGVDRFSVSSTGTPAQVITDAQNMLSTINLAARYSGSLMIPDPSFQNNEYAQEMLYGVTPAPEPTTLIAGAMLLLPFGASTLRFVRKNRKV